MITMSEEEMEKVCTLLDKLTLDTLTLMEQHIQNKIDVERLMSDGESDLAKARYIMGQTKVSRLQLPCEDSEEFEAGMIVHSEESPRILKDDTFELEARKKEDPMKWFGVLVPQALRSAQDKFKRAVGYSVKCANLQVRLSETVGLIEALRVRKNEIKKGLIDINS